MDIKPRFVSRSIWAPLATKRKLPRPVQVGTAKVERPKFFGGTKLVEEPVYETMPVDVVVPESETCIDLDALGSAVDSACNELRASGYDIVAINPIISGRFKSDVQEREAGTLKANFRWGWAYGFGYSVTEGVLITGRLRGHP